MALSNKALEALVWTLIYSGLLILCLGLFVMRAGEVLAGWLLVAVGAADALAGGVLLWLRSRRADETTPDS